MCVYIKKHFYGVNFTLLYILDSTSVLKLPFFSNNKEYTELKELENFQMSENKSFISLIILYIRFHVTLKVFYKADI